MSLLVLASVRNKIVPCIVTVSVSVHIEMFLSVGSPQVLNGRLGGRRECSRGVVQACMGAPCMGPGPLHLPGFKSARWPALRGRWHCFDMLAAGLSQLLGY